MSKRNQRLLLTTAIGALAYAHIEKPDTEAPAGAAFKPDGKFKGTLVVDDPALLEPIQEAALAALRAEFPEAPDDVALLNMPVKEGDTLGGKKATTFAGKTVLEAKSQFQPSIYDGTGAQAPRGVFPRSGDTVRMKVIPYPFKKDEKVREKVGGKMVEKTETFYGVSLRLSAIQIVRRGAGGGGGGFDAVEDGYVASPDDAVKPRSGEQPQEGEPRKPATNGSDF